MMALFVDAVVMQSLLLRSHKHARSGKLLTVKLCLQLLLQTKHDASVVFCFLQGCRNSASSARDKCKSNRCVVLMLVSKTILLLNKACRARRRRRKALEHSQRLGGRLEEV